MKWVMENYGWHDPGQPDWHRHSHEDSDVLWLPVVVPEIPGLDGQATHEEDGEHLKYIIKLESIIIVEKWINHNNNMIGNKIKSL